MLIKWGKKGRVKEIKSIRLKEGEFLAKNLNQHEIEKAYRFRYKIFCEELKWLPNNNNEKESDEYDQYSVHFGVFSRSGEIVGYSRIILPGNSFTLEKEFTDLLDPNYCIRKEKDTVEISRLAVKKELRGRQESATKISMLLYKIMYQWAVKNGVRYWYMVVETDYLKVLQMFFPCKSIGPVKEYQPNVSSVAALLDIREAESIVSKTNPALYSWFVSEAT